MGARPDTGSLMSRADSFAALFHCRFTHDGPVYVDACPAVATADAAAAGDPELRTYAIFAIDHSQEPERILGAVIFRTATGEDDEDIMELMMSAFASIPALRSVLSGDLVINAMTIDPTETLGTTQAARAIFMDFWISHRASQMLLQ